MLKVNAKALDRIAQREAAPATRKIADRIAASAAALAGSAPVRVIRDDGNTATRARSAIILTGPSPAARKVARDAGLAAFRAAGGQ
jgi:hypothetical protein